MIQPGMLIVDTKRCIACKRCMIECAVAHSKSKELAAAMQVSVPEAVDFADELPRLPTGKLYKRILRDTYWGKHDSKIV